MVCSLKCRQKRSDIRTKLVCMPIFFFSHV
nr:MAG TPA: hypothetical protein [Caudoviricetes sp.]